ncbi:Protein HESO1 [Cardamine amara subsp. amara]|uniref:Protein HESO1 n=1 Tax=Cardamine amara subsp. amara TaxID=228776 RepID=A0ABD1A9L0_CARAN
MAADLNDSSVMKEESSSSFSPVPPPPRSPSNQPEFWKRVEEATREIIEQVHPTLVSEDRRRDVIDYVQRLIKITLGCEVHSFGSVPLKTYLPDGDIDLTAFGGLCHEEELAAKVFSVLEREEYNGAAPFVVKDVQLIRAEVKLVKCLVQNIVVDISFNQIGGICTLCFLEKIDQHIGKDHLFKRSIILIKAWCYYESRILGAFHGLISTYALETLVLYIFHLFHSSLNGPLAVLYKFLDYFSKFDWDNYCISLNGPVCLSSLPEIAVEPPENGGEDLLLTSQFLKDCMEMYSVPSRGFETNPRVFPSKHLNIVDPLKENNNLGRSVSKGNFYRIRSAFTYGARKLGKIILQSEEDVSFELRKFFSNMLHRHGSGQRPDVLDGVPFVRYNRYNAISPAPTGNHFQEGQVVCESESSSSSGAAGNGRHDQEDSGVSISSTTGHDLSGSPGETPPSVSEVRFAGDANGLATLRIQTLEISDDAMKSPCLNDKESVSPLNGQHHSLHPMRNGEILNGNGNENENGHVGHEDLPFTGSVHQNSIVNLATWPQEGMQLHYSGHGVTGTPNLLSDLAGDYDSQVNSLRYGRWWLEYVQNGPPLPPLSPHGLPQLPNNNSWEVIRHALPFRRNAPAPVNANGVVPRQVFFHVNPQMIPGPGFGMEELPKPRGTGTYFPNANHYRDGTYSPRGRNSHPARSPRNNGRSMTHPHSEMNFPDRNTRERQLHYPNQTNGSCDTSQTDSLESFPDTNGSANHPYEKAPDFRSAEPLPAELVSPPEESKQRDSTGGQQNRPHRPKSIPSSTTQEDRVATPVQSYHLTDDHEFPPL